MAERAQGFPPQMVRDWIGVAVEFVKSGGIGCPECRGGLPSDAAKRGHDRHPRDCKGAMERVFGAYEMHTFLTQSAECWYGLPAASETAAPPVPQEPEDFVAEYHAWQRAAEAPTVYSQPLPDRCPTCGSFDKNGAGWRCDDDLDPRHAPPVPQEDR